MSRGFWAFVALLILAPWGATPAGGEAGMQFETERGTLEVHPVGHGSLYFIFDGQVVHVDPFARVADYASLPKADQVWITHHHPDHLDLDALRAVEKTTTVFVVNPASAAQLAGRRTVVLRNGETTVQGGVTIEAVPAYNLVRERQPGVKYHPRGEGNGYIATFGGFRVYVAGDTECVPEMERLGRIDLAFVPINLPFTMPPEEAAACLKVIAPRIAVPYHQGDADPHIVARLLEGSGIEVRVLRLP